MKNEVSDEKQWERCDAQCRRQRRGIRPDPITASAIAIVRDRSSRNTWALFYFMKNLP